MKIFSMVRNTDSTGISGTGRVLDGVIFDSGVTVVEWHGKSHVQSLGVYKTFEEFKFIHIDSHPENDTWIDWHDLQLLDDYVN